MYTQIRIALVCFTLVANAVAAPKPFSCMSYMEDDRSQQDNDDEFYDYSSKQAESSAEPASSLIAPPERRVCPVDYTFCFSLWRQTGNSTQIEKQGCWKESTERNATCNHSECWSSAPTSRNNSLYYCCCSGDVCNQKVTVVEPSPLKLSEASNLLKEQREVSTLWGTALIWYILSAAVMLASMCVAAFFYRRSIKEKPMAEADTLTSSGPGYSSNLRNVDNLNLVCLIGNGKYGTVMKGLLHDREVAVKIFPEAHHQYYINERNIYSLPLMDCPSLLTYFGYDERRTMDGRMEYQLVLSLAPLGCLQDYLIANTLSFENFCNMAQSITRGLSHLHTELRVDGSQKPCIAHRDLNSRNVLVKLDHTCCIADFGFALKVFGSRYEYKGETAMAETKSINEVGTLRYMAPELLEGAVNLRDCETSLKQMDVYALGLVLWEVATRCTDFYSPAQVVPPYKAPYELEVGSHPSFDQMQTLVVRHKARPLFPSGWGGGAAAKVIKDTCEDCWDHDAEARLTSLCAEERMQEVSCLRPRSQLLSQPASSLLNTNNLVSDHLDSTEKMRNFFREASTTEASTTLKSPPNQLIHSYATADQLLKDMPNALYTSLQTEKNHLHYPQQLQPYQGRNPCQERNLAPVANRPTQVLVEKSKKHSFQTEKSFSCLEDDVSVEDLIPGGSKKFEQLPPEAPSMGQGFPKQHNIDRKLRGWHGVRALIQKKLFRKDIPSEDHVIKHFHCGDEKSNLVDNHCTDMGSMLESPYKKHITVRLDQDTTTQLAYGKGELKAVNSGQSIGHSRRPNNLDLSPLAASGPRLIPKCSKNNLIHSITEELSGSDGVTLKNTNTRRSTPAHVVSRSRSSGLIKQTQNHNNNLGEAELRIMRNSSQYGVTAEPNFRRQHSLEVFREVFSGRGSTDKLRDVSQRVKTPGDVPPSVRKIRASKSLSLYDDRMMDSSTLNAL